MHRNRAVLLAATVLSLAAASSANAATITVTTESDSPGGCSLREAVSAANGDAPVGSCAAGSGADTIVLGAGHFELSIPGAGEDANASGDIDITSDLTIAGAGASRTTISGGRLDRVLGIAAGATVTVDGVTVTDGLAPSGAGAPDVHAPIEGVANGGTGKAGRRGGGIANAGALTVSHSAIEGNQAGAGGRGGEAFGGDGSPGGNGNGGTGGAGGDGGGIFSSGTLTLDSTSVSDNAAGAGGSGGAGHGGHGSDGTGAGSGAAGGNSFSGSGGQGGAGGGVAATGPVTLRSTTIEHNASGPGGVAESASGGNGGDGAGSGGGGQGGIAAGGSGGPGGPGGGLSAGGPADLVSSTVARNETGAGGTGGPTIGGPGGGGGNNNGYGGVGGVTSAGWGGNGGYGGGLSLAGSATLVNVTLDSNRTGRGGEAGAVFPTGGAGGHGLGTGGGGNGGSSHGGNGGNGGNGGALVTVKPATLSAVTISRNDTGGGGPSSFALGGPGGKHGDQGGADGASGFTLPGFPGAAGAAGAIVTVAGGKATVQGSIFAANSPDDCAGTLVNGGGNLGTNGCPGAAGDPRLGPLGDNGGLVPTRALRSGSAAVDAAGAGCPATDARGVARPNGAACDAGGYERALPAPATGAASELTPATATLNGTLVANGRASYRFEYGTGTGYGSRTPDADAGGDPRAALTGLAPATTYHYRLVATNGDGTSAGEDRTFTTAAATGGGDGSQGGGDGGDGGKPVTKPVLTKVSVHRRHGRSTVRYTLNEKARVTFSFRRGSRVKARATVSSKLGANRKAFARKVGRKALKPGRYRVTLVATDAAGHRSAARRVTIRVTRSARVSRPS